MLDELDSYMYQTVGHDVIPLLAKCFDLPLYRRQIKGSNIVQSLQYNQTEGDETEDLYELLNMVKENHPEVEAVAVGAILSNYQRIRVENVAMRLGLIPLAYLWEMDQKKLLGDMVESGVEAVLIKVAGAGLTSKDLGKTLQEVQPKLLALVFIIILFIYFFISKNLKIYANSRINVLVYIYVAKVVNMRVLFWIYLFSNGGSEL